MTTIATTVMSTGNVICGVDQVKHETALTIRAAVALQTAALEWDSDESGVQSDARQALIGMQEAMNVANSAFAQMRRATEKRRAAAMKG